MKIHPEDTERGVEAASPFFREVQIEFLIHELKKPGIDRRDRREGAA